MVVYGRFSVNSCSELNVLVCGSFTIKRINIGVMWVDLVDLKMSPASLFCTFWSLEKRCLGQPAKMSCSNLTFKLLLSAITHLYFFNFYCLCPFLFLNVFFFNLILINQMV